MRFFFVGDIRQEASLIKLKFPHQMFCLIVFGLFDCMLSHCFLTKRCRKQQEDLVGVVSLEALAQRVMVSRGNDVRPRMIRTHRVGGPGVGRGVIWLKLLVQQKKRWPAISGRRRN